MLKELMIVMLFVLYGFTANSQYNVRLQASLGIYNSPDEGKLNENYNSLPNNYSATIQYRFHKDWAAKISYYSWQFFKIYGWGTYGGRKVKSIIYEDIGPVSTWKKGDIEQRIGYQFIDAKITYTLNLKKRKDLYVGLGPTYAYGYDRVIIGVFGFPGYPDLLIEGEEVYRQYWGATWELGYDYMILKNRVNLGASLSGRYIFRQFSEYNLQINLGYNFNLGIKKKEREH